MKFLVLKMKNISSNFLMLLSLKIFVRIFGAITFFYLFGFLAKAKINTSEDIYIAISSLFYLMFFVFLDSITKVSVKFSLSDKVRKPLNILKGIPLIATFYLIYLKVEIYKNEFSAIDLSTPVFFNTKICPLVIIPNLSFIIITILIFYTSAILNRNKKLKEENDLTI